MKHIDRRTDIISPTRVHFLQFAQRTHNGTKFFKSTYFEQTTAIIKSIPT